jgi:hypothetical protein
MRRSTPTPGGTFLPGSTPSTYRRSWWGESGHHHARPWSERGSRSASVSSTGATEAVSFRIFCHFFDSCPRSNDGRRTLPVSLLGPASGAPTESVATIRCRSIPRLNHPGSLIFCVANRPYACAKTSSGIGSAGISGVHSEIPSSSSIAWVGLGAISVRRPSRAISASRRHHEWCRRSSCARPVRDRRLRSRLTIHPCSPCSTRQTPLGNSCHVGCGAHLPGPAPLHCRPVTPRSVARRSPTRSNQSGRRASARRSEVRSFGGGNTVKREPRR